LLYKIALINSRYSGMPVSPQVGQALFTGLIFMEMVLICGITPAITAGAISGEKEKQTYEMLLATPLHPASILWGKLVSALSYVFLLLFAAVPLASLIFMFGGVTLKDMAKALVILGATAVMVGVIGLFFSALLGRSGRATVVSYAFLIFLTFFFPFIAMAAGMFSPSYSSYGYMPIRWLMVPSPLAALFSSMASILNASGGNILFSLIGWLFWGAIQVPYDMTSVPRPIYHYSLPFFAVLSIILYFLASRLVLPVRRWKPRLKEWLIPLAVLLAVIGLTAFGYVSTAGSYENVVMPTEAPIMEPFMSAPVVQDVEVVTVEVTLEAPTADEPTPTPFDSPEGNPGGKSP